MLSALPYLLAERVLTLQRNAYSLEWMNVFFNG